MSIVRWIQFTDPSRKIPAEWVAFAGIIFSSSGLVNVLLYIITRPALLPSLHRFRGRKADDGRHVGRTGAGMPEITMMSVVEVPHPHHPPPQRSFPGNGPMLNDEDEMDEEYSYDRPQSTDPRMLDVPQQNVDGSSWRSDQSQSKISWGPESSNAHGSGV